MKFAVLTVVLLALVFNAHSSVIPLGLSGIGQILSVSGPLGQVVVPGGSISLQAPNLISIQGLPAAVTVAQSPIQTVALPAPVAAAPVAIAAAEGTYVAKTRGAVHVAPLAGHTQSATSVNLQPAPGTL